MLQKFDHIALISGLKKIEIGGLLQHSCIARVAQFICLIFSRKQNLWIEYQNNVLNIQNNVLNIL